MLRFPLICLMSAWLLLAFAIVPAAAQRSEGTAAASLRSERTRATEALNPARHRADALRHQAALSVHADRQRAEQAVRVIRQSSRQHPAYEYQVNGERRVSVAEPRRVQYQRARVVHHPSRQVDQIERDTARQAALYSSARPSLFDTGRAHQEAGYTLPTVQPVSPTLASTVHVSPTARVLDARHRAEAAVRLASHDRHVQREVYAGYHHTPRHHTPRLSSSLSGSLRFHASHGTHDRFTHRDRFIHRGDRFIHHHKPRVIVQRPFHHHRPLSRWHGGFRHHRYSSSFDCSPLRSHHRHHRRSSANLSIHIRF